MSITDKILEELKDKEAVEFLSLYALYAHAIDDLIDGDKEASADELLTIQHIHMQLLGTPFWLKNRERLEVVDVLINNTYADSIVLEKDITTNERGRILSHAGIDMFFAVLYICCGYGKLREYSLAFRNHNYATNP